jgi:hypothetical protein
VTSSAEATTHPSPEREEDAMNSTEQFGQELRENVARILGLDVKDVTPRR